MAENVALFGLLQLFADQGGTFQTDLHGGVAAAFQPLNQPRDLRRATRTVGAFDDDQFAAEPLRVHAGNAVAVEAFGRRFGHQHVAAGDGLESGGDAFRKGHAISAA